MNNFAQKFTLRQKISDYARSIGFDLVGFSPAKIQEKYLSAFENWLKEGHAADMEYMQKLEQRHDMTKVLPGAKSVIVLAMNYYHKQDPLTADHGRVARYAYGRDYHKVIGKKLKQLEKFIQELAASSAEKPALKNSSQKSAQASRSIPCGDFLSQKSSSESHSGPDFPPRGGEHKVRARASEAIPAKRGCESSEPIKQSNLLTKSYVDTGPVMERALAEQAGLGRIGKNGCLITKEFGSWVFLSEVITTLDLNFENSSSGRISASVQSEKSSLGKSVKLSPGTTHDRWSDLKSPSFNVCGNCRKCVTACPTGAIIAPGVVDSRLCISYLTIENKKKIPPKLAKLIKKTQRLFGCDICQEVCPHNEARQKINTHSELSTPKIATDEIPIQSIQQTKTDDQFLKTFAGSPLMRAKLKGLKRNAKILSP